ncbi:MAG: hypothetical protein CSA18_01845 [Deltaproteobacteria bacterium]|nr:MAG: hypothetical protein CSA18_01845 [Deltaproteobacteria bacterium]
MINQKQKYIVSASRKIFWTQFIVSSIFFGALSWGLFYGLDFLSINMKNINLSEISSEPLKNIVNNLYLIKDFTSFFILPAAGVLIFCFTFISWLIIRAFIKKIILTIPSGKTFVPKDDFDDKSDIELEKRKFLHLLSVLQEEGRFIDFLNENLSDYDDEDIGAAVRSIHKGCKDGISRYLELKPLLEIDEDEPFEVDSGFNPDMIKLTGNVVGNPPFKGVVRHRGWKAENINMPELKKVNDASFLVPAEIEIE